MPERELFYVHLGERIKDLRKYRKLTQADLSAQLGMTRTSIVNIEAGRQRIQLHDFAELCEVLNVNPAEILEGLCLTN